MLVNSELAKIVEREKLAKKLAQLGSRCVQYFKSFNDILSPLLEGANIH